MAFSIIRLFRSNYGVMYPSLIRPYSRTAGYSYRRPSKVRVPFEASNLQEEEIINLDPNILQNGKEFEHNEKKVADLNSAKKVNSRIKPRGIKQHNYRDESDTKEPMELKKQIFKDVETQNGNSPSDDHLNHKAKEKKKVPIKLFSKLSQQDNVFDENGDIIYEKLKDEDTRVTILITRAKSKNIRSKSNQILVEGWRLIAEGLLAGCKLDVVLFSRKTDLLNLRFFLPKTGPKLYKMPYKEIQMWSNLETSPGIMGIFQTPDLSFNEIKPNKDFLPLNIICDNIRDPGNLGSILRTAFAVGCQELILTKGCVDLWDPKVIRSAGGAHFNMKIRHDVLWSQCESLIKENSFVCVADNKEAMPEVESRTSSESTNLSYDKRRSLKETMLNEDTLNFTANETNIESIVESSNKFDILNIPIMPYYEVDFKSYDSVTLVIGGETQGISSNCYLFIDKFQGMRLNIPMQTDVDSLNSGTATAIISFEIRKQLKSQIYNKFLNAVHSS